MQDMFVDSSNMMYSLLSAIIASRYDLMMFAVGLMGYIILFSIRKKHAVKEVHKEADIRFEETQAIDTKHGLDVASAHLVRVLESMQCCADADFVTAEMNGFLQKYPDHRFELHEVQSILSFCRSLTDKALADLLLEHMQPAEEWHVLSAFIRFYLDSKQSEKGCNVFELNYATFFDIELDEQMEWQLLLAALQCGRQPLAEHLLQTSQSDAAKHVATIQRWWTRKSANIAESRVANMGDVLNRLSNMFNERYPFEEHSDGESTCFLGDDSDWEESDDENYKCGEYT